MRKSAMLVYGEGKKEHEKACKDRMFMLGRDRIMEKVSTTTWGSRRAFLRITVG